MLDAATALGRSGLQDWILQRVSAVILALYTLLVVGFWIYVPNNDINLWKNFFENLLVQYATFLALLALVIHAWIGIWTITTDYLKETSLRLTTQVIVYLALLLYLVWGVQIIWG